VRSGWSRPGPWRRRRWLARRDPGWLRQGFALAAGPSALWIASWSRAPVGWPWSIEALGVPEAQVRVVVPDTGGGFGGKHGGEVAEGAARLARASGRPVKVRWSREEEFRRGHFRPAAVIDVRSGASLDGAIAAWEMRNTNSGMFGLVGPYEIPNQRLDYQPADSLLPQGPYRALAATANHFARESHMDELADALGVDPLELRLRHLRDDRLAAVLRAAAERIGWAGRPDAPGLGMGLAGGVEKGARIATAATVRVGADRRLEILRIVTAFECGAIVNPDGLANQVEGATVMGLGAAVFEAIHFEAGRITNASLSDYRVPRITDVPPIEVILLDRRDLASAGGGRRRSSRSPRPSPTRSSPRLGYASGRCPLRPAGSSLAAGRADRRIAMMER
jgi:nicotinate dehydrogenase subunit B